MSDTSSTFGAYAAAELIAAKAAGRHFKQGELASFIDILHHDWQLRAPDTRTMAIGILSDPPKIDAEAIYQAYPRKVGKKAALKAITAAIVSQGKTTRSQSAAASIYEATKAYAAAVATWPARDREYVPHPATWFNRGSYLDDPKEWQAKGARTAAPDKPRDYSRL